MFLFRRSLPILMLIALAGGISGCAEKEPPKPATPPPPPPPTPEEIAAKITAEAGLNDPLPAVGDTFTKEAAEALKKTLRNAKSLQSKTPEGQRALQIVNSQLDQRIHALEDAGAWEHTLGAVEAFDILNPKSPKWQTTKETAIAELQKPKITIFGFMQDYALLDFYLPISKETHREKMRPGEELFGVTLMEVIGKNQGLKFRYAQTGQTFDVMTKSASK